MIVAVFLCVVAACIVLGTPSTFSIFAGIFAVVFMMELPPDILFISLTSSIDSFPLVAIPCFFLVSELLGVTGMPQRLAVFPRKIFRLNRTEVSPPLLPLWILLIIAGVMANASIFQLFINSMVVGIVICAALWLRHLFVDQQEAEVVDDSKDTVKAIIDWAIIVFLIARFLLGIIAGIFTPTEASALFGIAALVYAVIVSLLIYREISFGQLVVALASAAKKAILTLFAVGVVSVLAIIMNFSEIPQFFMNAIASDTVSPALILTGIVVLTLIAGIVLDAIIAVVLILALFMPSLMALGIDPQFATTLIVLSASSGLYLAPRDNILAPALSRKIGSHESLRLYWPAFIVHLVVIVIFYAMTFQASSF